MLMKIKFLVRNIFNKVSFFAALCILFYRCIEIPSKIPDYEVSAKWADMTLFITKNTPANSPTFASRCFGYLGLAQYEAVVHGEENFKSLAGQIFLSKTAK